MIITMKKNDAILQRKKRIVELFRERNLFMKLKGSTICEQGRLMWIMLHMLN